MRTWRRSVIATKKEAIMDFFKRDPSLSNKNIANLTGSSISYVNQLIGKRDPTKEIFHSSRAIKMAKNYSKDFWRNTKTQIDDFVENFLPPREDFSNFLLPTDDAFSSAGSGQDLTNSFSQYQWLAERRIGLGPRITWDMAVDAVRNDIFFVDVATEERVERPKIRQWMIDTKFFDALKTAIYYERVYGISFLVKYYTENDRENEKMEEPPNKNGKIRKPIAFQAFPPTLMAPQDFQTYDKLDKDPNQWDVFGGVRDPKMINRERVEVFMSRPVVNRWYGTSIFEPIWYSVISYYQALIFLLRGFSKLGNTVTGYEIDDPEDLDAIYEKHGNLIEDMVMNGIIIHKIGTKLTFQPTQLGTGLKELIDIWLEDVSAGTGVPVPMLVGRVEAAGLGSQAYLTMERKSANAIAKIQECFTLNVRNIIESAGFNLKGLRIDFGLALIKTDAQRYADELAKVEVELAKKQLVMTDLQIDAQKLQNEMTEYQMAGDMLGLNEDKEGNNNMKNTQKQIKDFIEALIEKRNQFKEKRLAILDKLVKTEGFKP